MRIDPSSYVPLDLSGSLGASAAGASFATSSGDVLEVGSFGVGVLRLRVGPNTRPDYAILSARAQKCDVARLAPDRWLFTAGDARLELGAAPLTFKLQYGDATVVTSTTDEKPHNEMRDRTTRGSTRLPVIGRARDGKSWLAALALVSGEPLYGLGDSFGSLNKRGQIVTSRTSSTEVHVASTTRGDSGGDSSSAPIPFCWSPGSGAGAWGIFAHTPAPVSHGIGFAEWSHRSYGLLVDDEALDLFMIVARDPAQLLDRYTALTGRPAAVPAWSLGLWIDTATTSAHGDIDEATAIADDLRRRTIPGDTLMLAADALSDPQTRFDFQLDAARCADPAAAIARITSHGLRVCAWEYPCVSVYSPLFIELASKRYLLTDESGAPFVFGGEDNALDDEATNEKSEGGDATRSGNPPQPPESGIIDFTNPDAYGWWRDAHQPWFKAGVALMNAADGAWISEDVHAFNGDQGTRLRHVYPLLYRRCVADATRKFAPGAPAPMLIAGIAPTAASQRYPLQSGASVQSDWEGLAAAVRAALAAGMTGLPHSALRVGGSYSADEPSPELCLRWLQASVFASHVIMSGAGARALWSRDDEIGQLARTWIEFRYRLVPYLQTMMKRAAKTGLPLMRAMPLAFPHNALTRAYDTQFMCGDALLVAPIIAAGGEVDVALPPGAWYDLASRQRLAGRQVIRYRAGLDRFPVFGREGYVLPLGPVVQHTGQLDSDRPLDALWVFGKPSLACDDYAQVRVSVDANAPNGPNIGVAAMADVSVEVFGDASSVAITVLQP